MDCTKILSKKILFTKILGLLMDILNTGVHKRKPTLNSDQNNNKDTQRRYSPAFNEAPLECCQRT